MGWPQIVVLVFMFLSILVTTVHYSKNPDLSSGWLIFTILLHVGSVIGYALILHAGGFW